MEDHYQNSHNVESCMYQGWLSFVYVREPPAPDFQWKITSHLTSTIEL